MRRRIALGLGIGLAAASFVLPASGATPPPPDPPLPHYPCAQGFTDIKGDAAPQYGGNTDTSAVFPNKPELDIRSVNVQLTSDQLQVFMAVDGIVAFPQMQYYESAYRYTITFLYDGKTFTYASQLTNPAVPAQPLDSSEYPKMNMGTGPLDMKSSSTAVVRPGDGTAAKPSWLIFTSPRALIEKNLGATIPNGAKFTTLKAETQVYTSAENVIADSLDTPADKATYVVGADACFGPPATNIGSLTAAPAQWSDASTLSAVLLDASAKPLAGKALTFSIAGTSFTKTVTTDSSGRATATYSPVLLHAGSYPVTVQFAGDDNAKASSATGALQVSLESCAFKPLKVTNAPGNKRTVTATLLDNDNHPVVGVPVDWWVNGKKTATGKTDKAGRVSLRSGKPGQKVQAKFAGAAGTLSPAMSKTVKL